MGADELPFGKVDLQGRRCPICGKPAIAEADPFCSTRCANVDLHRWLSGAYAVPTDEPGGPERLPDANGEDV